MPAKQAADSAEIRGWLSGRLPEWFDGPPEVIVDREEITIIGTLPSPEVSADAGEAERTAARRGRAKAFREQTREQRIGIAQELEATYSRAVAWGALHTQVPAK